MIEQFGKDGNLLEIKNLVIQFSHEEEVFTAVNGISFSVSEKETVGLVGESGSGKTVTALSVLQLLSKPPLRVLEGEIFFKSSDLGWIDLLKLSDNEKRHIRGNEIGYVFQEPMTALNPVFSCGSQIMETIKIHKEILSKECKELAFHLLEKVKLSDPGRVFSSFPFELSGGQKQRIIIAQALACNPKLLIADEPTTALDVTIQSEIIKLLDDLKKEFNLSVLFITHDLNVIAGNSDRVLVMFQGKIVEEGSLWQIFSDPQHPYTKGLLACRPRMNVQLKMLPTVYDFIGLDNQGNVIEKKETYRSIGEAIILNAESSEDLIERRLEVVKRGPILKVKNLVKKFPIRTSRFSHEISYVTAIDDVSFEIFDGETIGLVGESGCGKTTLGRVVIRLLEADSGEIEFEKRDITFTDKEGLRDIRKRMQIIFQDPNAALDSRQAIGDTIVEPMIIHKLYQNPAGRRNRAIELLEMVGLGSDDFFRFPHEFSGGQRQRICIARVLACEPKFIICDESVSALDVSVQAQILNLLNKLKKDFKLTFLFISHDLSVIRFMSDRIFVMRDGRFIETGYAETLFDKPKEEYTRKLIEAIPKGDLEEIRKHQLRKKMEQKTAIVT
jgi:peptide/nickel transport system ATP-binding protein